MVFAIVSQHNFVSPEEEIKISACNAHNKLLAPGCKSLERMLRYIQFRGLICKSRDFINSHVSVVVLSYLTHHYLTILCA